MLRRALELCVCVVVITSCSWHGNVDASYTCTSSMLATIQATEIPLPCDHPIPCSDFPHANTFQHIWLAVCHQSSNQPPCFPFLGQMFLFSSLTRDSLPHSSTCSVGMFPPIPRPGCTIGRCWGRGRGKG